MGCSQSSRLEFQRCRSLALLVLVLEEAAASLDKHEHCAKWANSGECEANPGFMWKTCESSCSRTGGRKPWASDPTAVRCQSWVKAGECQTNADFMLKTCPSSCDSAAPAGAAPAKEFDQPSPARQQPAKPRNVSRNLKEEQQRQQEEIKRRAEQLRRERQNKTRRGAAATAAEIPVSTTTTTATVTTTTTTTTTRAAAELAEAERVEAERVKATEKVEEIQIEAKAKDAEPEALKPWQMPAPSDVDDETFKCMREKFEIARQLDDANAREQSVRERAEAANGRASASEQRHRDCLKDLSEANQERQRMRAQQSDSLSEQYEQRVQELREQLRKELGQETAKLQKECSKREFQLQELARVANKRADQAEAQLAGRATGEDRLQAERRAAEHAQEAQAAEQARLKIEEAYRAGHLREQELQERLAKVEARVKLLEGQLETVETGEVLKVAQEQIAREPPVELVVEPLHCEREAEALFDALQQVFVKTFVLLWAPLSVFFGRPPLVTLPPNLVKLLFWMDRPAESVLEGLAALGGGSSLQMKDMCHVSRHVPGSAVCALAWLVTCASLAVYFTSLALRLAWNSMDLGARGASVSASSSSSMVQGRLAVNHLAALFLPVTRFFDAFSVPEDVRRIAERRAELGHSAANQGTATIGASGSEPEPEEIYRRPAALEALLAAEDAANSQDPRPSPRFGAPDGVHDSAAGPVTS